jgi:predicted PurR-regulated permease PerM
MFIAFYMLCEKEAAARAVQKILFLTLSEKSASKVIAVVKDSNVVFERFLVGKALDSAIIGCLFFIVGSIFKLPLMIIFSLIVGITNMVPYFGPIFGAVPVILITLIADPPKAFWAFLIVFIIQQFDGVILGPKILGDSTGVKPLGVVFAIIVGGAMFGVAGMLFGVPVFAVLQTMISAFINRKFEEKRAGGKE